MTGKIRSILCSTAAFAALTASAGAIAQQVEQPADDEAADSSEIVVTATRQSQSLNKVPLSVSAFTRDAIDSRGIRDFTDIIRQTTGVTFERSNTTTNIAIRGVNSSVGAATTGIYIDDVPIQIRQLGYGGGNVYPLVFDLDRVEVLRGPQGTLFGAGSEGGTVRFITRQPSLSAPHVYGRAELSGSEHGAASGEAGISLSGPFVNDTLGVAASIYYRRDGGYVDRVYAGTVANPSSTTNPPIVEKNANYNDSFVGRAALTWQPTPDLKITPSFYYQEVDANDSGENWERFSDYSRHIFRNGDPVRENSADIFKLTSLNISYNLGPVDIIGVGSYFDRRQRFIQDYTTFDQTLFTGPNLPFFADQQAPAFFEIDQKNWTGELRIQSNRPEPVYPLDPP